MNRREALKAIGLTTGAIAPVDATAASSTKYGRMTVDRSRLHEKQTGEFIRVYFNGVDVTEDCYEADDRAGYALLRCRDERCPNAKAVGAGSDELHVFSVEDRGLGPCSYRLDGDVSMQPGLDMWTNTHKFRALKAKAERFGAP
jgi:hypothetical protein